MSHDDFQTEPVRGLPENLPEGERILWQGQPDWWALTKESLSFWWVAGYFFFLFAWRTISGAATESWIDSATAASFFLVLGGFVCLLLIIMGLIQAKTTMYTVTNKRVAMRIGAALTVTLNLPFRQVVNASLGLRRDGTGTIALELTEESGFRPSYLNTWPHVRPWKMKNTQPALRCIPEAKKVAEILSEAAATAVSHPVVEVTSNTQHAAGHGPVAAE
ncbi:photosynthetic complex putative assembly protein PuhB [Roseibacterium beibuensis]|uniref:Photosynthetic complex putative assembly protein PuhB n=1 Tax=[Roseibacterium] beibuensis TaxID=1193142 RepID=A0ABP9LD19_9RHOB|nr:photosynthetic complex putative assembly protein PuhB [Roseibacterium beibuensis]MCS6623157.1 photosynthetic complex putative assembly protein PuhB [Roseibacterium beibuensis]